MKDLILKIPGKSFLAGEYLALHGGPSLVAATKPQFKIRIHSKVEANSSRSSSKAPIFHPQSPAGKFYAEQIEFFEQFSFDWLNPYGPGGFGASTAEFIGLHALFQMRDSLWIEQERHFDLHEMLKSYRSYAKDPNSNWTPSGADLVAQVRGGITYLEARSGRMQNFAWPFENIGFALIRTGNKLPTHEHLKALGEFDFSGLELATLKMCEAIQNLNAEAWVQGVQQLSSQLLALSFVAPRTQEILQQLSLVGVLAAKGCGALGADVVVAFYAKNIELEVLHNIQHLDLALVATDRDLSEGLSVFVEHQSGEKYDH